ncbi:1,4-alpha-glucan branching enzyme GlgB [compost metagenome]
MEGYQWIDADDNAQSVVSYIRRGKKPVDTLLIIINFQPVERRDYRIGVPRPGTYEEIFSSENIEFGGSGIHNEPLKSTKNEWHSQLNSLELTLPPLSFLVLKKAGRKPKSGLE